MSRSSQSEIDGVGVQLYPCRLIEKLTKSREGEVSSSDIDELTRPGPGENAIRDVI